MEGFNRLYILSVFSFLPGRRVLPEERLQQRIKVSMWILAVTDIHFHTPCVEPSDFLASTASPGSSACWEACQGGVPIATRTQDTRVVDKLP